MSEETAINDFDGLIICAAGNDGYNNDVKLPSPASYDSDNILSVGALNGTAIASYSNYGATTVDVFAPGTNIYSANSSGGGDATLSGTSFAAPYVAGIAALIWSVNPDFSAEEVKDIIIDTVDKLDSLDGKCVSEGRVNAYKALEEAYVRTPAAVGAQQGKTLVEPQTVTGDVNGDGTRIWWLREMRMDISALPLFSASLMVHLARV